MGNNLDPLSKALIDRLKVGVSSSLDLSHLSDWLIANTSDPKNSLKRWSFKDHEYQIEILNDRARKLVVRKPSQVGISELIVRMALGMLSMLRNHTAIYTMPTSGAASKFSKTRFDTVIANSKVLRNLVDPDNDSVELKKIGTCFLYILGTFTQKAAISTPADILINDEIDFSNPQALTTFSSRLGHAENGGIRRIFSTPTVNGYGVSKELDVSSQAWRGIVCDGCHDTVFPEFFKDVIIPGFDNELEKLEKDDIIDNRYAINEAFLKCPECGHKFTPNNLADPEKRRWVAKYPDREAHGYQVMPYDVPTINTIPKVLMSLSEYDRKSDWVNFKVGLPFEDAESSFMADVLKSCKIAQPVYPPSIETQGDHAKLDRPVGLVMGVDVGKVSHVVVGRPIGRRRIAIIWMERIRQTGEGDLLKRLVFLTKWFGVSKGVIDAAPDFTTSMAFVEAFKMGRTYANYYARNKSKNTLDHISVNDQEGILSTVRTESFDLLVKRANSYDLELPRMEESDLLIEHCRNMKRVEHENNQGDQIANWINTGPDHYAHALNYMYIAATLLEDRFAVPGTVGVLPMATAARLKT